MNEFQQVYPNAYGIADQNILAPQGIFGSLGGGALGGLIGRGIGGLFRNPSLGGRIGQTIGGIGGGFLPFSVDPVTAAYAQQQQMQQAQLAPQGWFGNLLGQVGQPLGSAIGGIFGNSNLGGTIGNVAGQIGSLLPFGVDPVSAAYAQQQQQQIQLQQLQQMQQLQDLQQQQQLQQLAQQGQLAPQGLFGNILGRIGRPLGGAIGGIFGNSGIGRTIGGVAGGLGRFLPFEADPVAQAYAQQAQQQMQLQQLQQQAQLEQLAQQGQLAPQGWFGNILSQVGQPLGGAIGGIFGQSGIGSAIGGAAAQLGRILPFGVDPMAAAAYAQQAQLAQQQLAQQQLAQQQMAQQAQLGQQANGYFAGYQGNPGVGQQANLYGGQQTVH